MQPIGNLCGVLLLAGCGGARPALHSPAGLALPDSSTVLETSTGRTLTAGELQQRLAAAELVLLGEVHDNPVQHDLRGRLIAGSGSRAPAIVFEQFAESAGPIPRPAAGASLEAWLDQSGFDRAGWKWPLHRPVVEAAIAHGRSLWGSGVSRESLRSVVRGGEAAAPDHLRSLLEQAPLDSVARSALDRELVAGHCGRLAEGMIPGMRAAQTVRDAAMSRALIRAGADGPAWLIAGNGHVRRDIAVPRMLRMLAPGKSVLVAGLLERGADGSDPDAAERNRYDLVIVTPRAARADPCSTLQGR